MKVSNPILTGSKDFKERVALFRSIDRILVESGLEKTLKSIMVDHEEKERGQSFDPKDQLRFQRSISKSLRTNIARVLSRKSFKEFSIELADSFTLQSFCGYDSPTTRKIPSKSHLHDLSKLIPVDILNKMIDHLSKYLESNEQCEFDFSSVFADSTCIELNIHHPVDWVLLKDAVISIMKSVKCIRRHGLKHRIPAPDGFIKRVNNITMAISMSKKLRIQDSKKERKRQFRELKSLLRICEAHGHRYLKLLQENWVKTDLSEKQSERISARMTNVLDQIDLIIHQAHERMIGERQVHNKDKILSLHERHAKVYKRGKAGADVEFGLQLFIAENRDGIIVDWNLHDEIPKKDNKFVQPCIEHLKSIDIAPESFCADRGFWAKRAIDFLEREEIDNLICPTGPVLSEKLQEENFKIAANRRSQTEGRIGILKNNFLGGHLRSKGFENQKTQVGWAILTHNLWVASRRIIAEEEPPLEIAA